MKSLSALLRGITSNHDGDFYCLNCFRSYRTEKKLKKHESVCNDHDFCCVEMPDEGSKILRYNYGEKSLKGPFMIYADWSVCLKKCTHVKIILKNLIQRKKLGNGYSLFTNCLLDVAKIKLDCYRSKDCMEKFCGDSRQHAMKIITYEKKDTAN